MDSISNNVLVILLRSIDKESRNTIFIIPAFNPVEGLWFDKESRNTIFFSLNGFALFMLWFDKESRNTIFSEEVHDILRTVVV